MGRPGGLTTLKGDCGAGQIGARDQTKQGTCTGDSSRGKQQGKIEKLGEESW